MWAYAYMKGWKQQRHIDFDFQDAHALNILTRNAQNEAYIKAKLLVRMKASRKVIVLIGESTKYLYKYVRWELATALSLGLPIIVINLNEKRQLDHNLCPAILRNAGAVHIPFRRNIIKYALGQFNLRSGNNSRSAYHYPKSVYDKLNP